MSNTTHLMGMGGNQEEIHYMIRNHGVGFPLVLYDSLFCKHAKRALTVRVHQAEIKNYPCNSGSFFLPKEAMLFFFFIKYLIFLSMQLDLGKVFQKNNPL